jgi:hypothetical protein
VRVFKLDQHFFGIGNEIGRDVATIELHPIHHFKFRLERLCFLDSNDALATDPFQGICDEPADLCIAVGRDRGNLSDLLIRGQLPRLFL